MDRERFKSGHDAQLAHLPGEPLARPPVHVGCGPVVALRGFDALHLASFAEVVRRAGASNTQFSSFDDPLNNAARDVARRLSAGI